MTYADILPAVDAECGRHPDCFARYADDCPYIDICRRHLTRDRFEAAMVDRYASLNRTPAAEERRQKGYNDEATP